VIRFLPPIVLAIASVPTLALAACDDLKMRIAEGLTAKGVSGFQLDIVAIDAVDARAVVGRCEAGSKKILYSRGETEGAPMAPRAPTTVAPTVDAVPTKPSRMSVPDSSAVTKSTRSEQANKAFRDPLQQGGEGPLMVIIPTGEFMMGSTVRGIDRRYRESPEHGVRVAAFALARTEVTFDDYDRFAQASGRRLPDDDGQGRGKRPVVNVSWYDASEYAQWLSAQTGFSYRLPSEAEWEYAARAGGKRGAAYSTGDCIAARQANFNDAPATTFNNCPASNISLGKAQSVGSYAPNGFGLYDMHGNVFEWAADCMHLGYEQAPSDGSAWLQEADGNCDQRIVRGGSWQSGQISVRSSLRAAIGSKDSSGLIGFRVARVISPQ